MLNATQLVKQYPEIFNKPHLLNLSNPDKINTVLAELIAIPELKTAIEAVVNY